MTKICNSRNFTMVYTQVGVKVRVRCICNSRNFTMVYTQHALQHTALQSAIAEILLWFTPNADNLQLADISAIAEILLWFTPNWWRYS